MIKNILFIVLLFTGFTTVIAQNITRYIVTPPLSNITTIIDGSTIPGLIPGDTIAITGGKYYQLLIRNITGSKSNPIIIINRGTQVCVSENTVYGVKLGGCNYLKFTGKGNNSDYYGIIIRDIVTSLSTGGIGLSIDDLSTSIEIENVEIKNVTYVGIMAKTDPSCLFSSQYGSFVMRDLFIHDTYIHKIGHEGMYVGSSKFKDGYVINCNGVNSTVYPHLLKNLKIYKNIVDSTGWDGIQIGCADSAKVYNNKVSRDSQADSLNQMSGILIGGGSQNIDCYSNKIVNGHGDAVEILGQGKIKVYNNLIVNPGQGISLPNQYKHGVFINTGASTNPGWVYVLNNTIITPKTYGIYFINNIDQSRASNNIIIVNNSYVNALVYVQNNYLDNSYNLTKNTVNESLNLFNDPTHDDYSLTFFSEAKDKGVDLSSYGVTFDILDNPRPYPASGNYDKGAYEYTPGVGIISNENEVTDFNICPNPNNGQFKINFSLVRSSRLSVKIYNTIGSCVFDSGIQRFNTYENSYSINNTFFTKGFYLVKIQGEEIQRSLKMIVTK
jgi:hypothetical protein